MRRTVRRWPPSAGSSSAPRSATATSPASAAASSTWTPAELTADVLYQIGALDGDVPGGRHPRSRYVKPHGALYNAIVHHEAQAAAVVEAVRAYAPALPVLGLPGSAFLRAAEAAGLRTVREAFADRGYTPTGALVPRSRAGRRAARPGRGRRAGAAARRPRAWWRRSTAATSPCRPSRCASTATRRARSRWPARGAGRARAQAGRHACGRSHEGAAVRRRRAARRGRRARRGARRWPRRCAAARPAGVLDVVPAARTVLLTRRRRARTSAAAAAGRPGPARRPGIGAARARRSRSR